MARKGGTPENLVHHRNGPGRGRTKGSKNAITRDSWDNEVRYLAHSNLIDAFEAVHGNKRSFTLRELRAMPERIQRAISSVKVRTENLVPGDDAQDTTIEIKLWDKTKALELGARANGWLKDVVQVQGLPERKERLRRGLAKPPTHE